jgi:hypothetical protein
MKHSTILKKLKALELINDQFLDHYPGRIDLRMSTKSCIYTLALFQWEHFTDLYLLNNGKRRAKPKYTLGKSIELTTTRPKTIIDRLVGSGFFTDKAIKIIEKGDFMIKYKNNNPIRARVHHLGAEILYYVYNHLLRADGKWKKNAV